MSNTLISIRIWILSIFKGSLIWVSDRQGQSFTKFYFH